MNMLQVWDNFVEWPLSIHVYMFGKGDQAQVGGFRSKHLPILHRELLTQRNRKQKLTLH